MKETLIAALSEAGKELMSYFGKNIGYSVKESQSSIVTQADFRSDALISEMITTRFPEHNILAEESGFCNRHSRYTWVVDPLDGTSNFAAGIPWFGVLIAVLEDSVPIMGGAYLPVSGDLYFAEKGRGATLNGTTLTIKQGTLLKNSLFSFNVDFTEDMKALDNCLRIYRNVVGAVRNIRCTNCLMDFLYVAEGKFGGVLNMFTRIWDIAALGLILEEAGGEIRYADGTRIVYVLDENTPHLNYPVMAGPTAILDELTRTVL